MMRSMLTCVRAVAPHSSRSSSSLLLAAPCVAAAPAVVSWRLMHTMAARTRVQPMQRSAASFSSSTAAAPSTPAATSTSTPIEGEVTLTMYGDGWSREVSGREGETLLNVAQINDVDQIEGACEGCMCCSTCHMIFDPATFAKLGPVPDDEQDIIDRAAGVTDTSRLGCQVRVSKRLQGAKIRIPSEFVNQMV